MKLPAICLHWYQIESFIFAFLTSNKFLTWALFDRTAKKKSLDTRIFWHSQKRQLKEL